LTTTTTPKRARGLFPYSGSKARVAHLLPAPPSGVSAIVEPFAGSLAYALRHRPARVAAAEAHPLMRELWRWLAQEATPEELLSLESMRPTEKIDLRSLDLSPAQTTLLRLACSGAYVGQLSSWIAYPQHRVSFALLREALPYLRRALCVPFAPDFRALEPELYERRDVAWFIDPPYLGTNPNYGAPSPSSASWRPADVEALVRSVAGPWLVTYGDGAPDLFPSLPWRELPARYVPILRGGGTRLRREFFACSWAA
jgi:hypothetical protein